jgi:hypothetical protein
MEITDEILDLAHKKNPGEVLRCCYCVAIVFLMCCSCVSHTHPDKRRVVMCCYCVANVLLLCC